MFKASGCHLLLGNAALIILGGLIARLNGLDANDRTPAATSLHTVASVRRSAAYLPQLNSFNENSSSRKDTYVDWNDWHAGLRNDAAPCSRTSRRATKHRFKRSSPANNESSKREKSAGSINQPGTIRSANENELKQNTTKIGSGRSATPTTRSQQQPTTARPLSNQETAANELQIINNYTNDITKLGVGRDPTNYKSPPNIGYKYYDPMRKHGRPSKDPNRDTDMVGWNSLLKLVFLLLICTAGTTGNIFVISSIMIIDQFQMQGNLYLVSLALAQLLISIVAVPATCIEIMMATTPNHPEICHFQFSVTIFTITIVSLSFMLISIENVSALRRRSLFNHNLFCSKFRIIFLVFLSWLIAGMIVFAQKRYNLAPALCQQELVKRQSGTVWPPYHLTVIVSVFLLPTLVTMACFLKSAISVKRINIQLENNPLDTPWQLVVADGELVTANVIVYLFTFFSWLPIFIVAVLSVFRHVSVELTNTFWWLAWGSSLTYPYVYSFFNQNFGKTFSKLFFYCCCKSHLSIEGKTTMNLRRNEHATGPGTNNMELRVHLIPGLNMNQRRDDYFHLNSSGPNTGIGLTNINKCAKYGTVSVGRNTRSIPASDGGLGFGSAQHGGGGFHKWDSRVDSDAGSNYSGNPLHRSFGSRSYSHSYSSHLVDDAAYEHTKRYGGPSNQKYYI